MEHVDIGRESIELQHVLKVAGWAATGGQAKILIQSGVIQVNGRTETRRSHRLHPGDVVSWEGRAVVLRAAPAR